MHNAKSKLARARPGPLTRAAHAVIRLVLLVVAALAGCDPALDPFMLPQLEDAGAESETSAQSMAADAAVMAVPDVPDRPRRNDAGPPLPAALKGYELYAWSQDGQLNFTLIVGTNRQKTLEEVMGRAGGTIPDEAAPIHGVGGAQLSRVLMRVPRATSVIFTTLPDLPPLSAEERATVERLVASRGTP
jgi:hypothetical protein